MFGFVMMNLLDFCDANFLGCGTMTKISLQAFME